LPSRPAALFVAMSVALLALGLAACAARQTPPPQSATTGLIARGLDAIAEFYIDPIAGRKLVLLGAQNLARLDGTLMVGENSRPGRPRELVLTGDHRLLGTFAEPKNGDNPRWAKLLARLVADAEAASPKLASLPPESTLSALFDGFTSALDRFSRYSPPEAARLERALRNGFGGIGITLDNSKKGLVVTAVLPQGPAERAGIHPRDRILAIDGKPPSALAENEIVARLRGAVGSVLNLAVYRTDPPQRLRFRIKRGRIVIPSVKVSEAGGIGVFKIASFNESTAAMVAKRLLDGGRPPLKGVVLDLRGNPGGLLEQAVELVDLFVGKGPIAATIGRNPLSEQYFVASGDAVAPALPVVVVIDGRSASSSEIVASALQDRGRAVVLGSSSYGKGTVQTVLTLPNGGTLTLTWARLVTPEGYLLEHHGVVPNLCTSRLAGAGDWSSILLRQARAPGRLSAKPRRSLDEAGWEALRRSCPRRRKARSIDLKVAARLLSDPPLYRRALRLVAAAALAAPAPAPGGARGEGPALTRSGALLFFVRHRP
jgi:carboxyl-terminal processing protease